MSGENSNKYKVNVYMRSGAVVEFDCSNFNSEQRPDGDFCSFGWTESCGVILHGINPAQIDAITYIEQERS